MADILVVRSDTSKLYTTINLSCILDSNLSWKAKGLHTYFSTRPKGWRIWKNDLLKRATDGSFSLQSTIKELKDSKYLYSTELRDKSGMFKGTAYAVFKTPTEKEEAEEVLEVLKAETLTSIEVEPEAGFRAMVKPLAENQTLSIRDIREEKEDSKESEEVKTSSQAEAEHRLSSEGEKIFKFWNSFANSKINGLTTHRNSSSKCSVKNLEAKINSVFTVEEAINAALIKFSYLQIKKGMKIYFQILTETGVYYVRNRLTSLHRFLLSKVGLELFLQEDIKTQFLRSNSPKDPKDPFDIIRFKFSPITEEWNKLNILDKDNSTYYGFKTEVLKKIDSYKRDLDETIELGGDLTYPDFWKLENVIASLLFKRRFSPDLLSLKQYFEIWEKLSPKFLIEKEKA